MVKSGGEMTCNMNENDISHFEQAFSAINKAVNLNKQTSNKQTWGR